jgi:cytochrome P450
VSIDITHPDLIQDFYTPENIINNPKVKILYQYIARGVGFGIAFSEKDIWKRKRRIVSQVFNFDLLKALTYKIENICTREIEAI